MADSGNASALEWTRPDQVMQLHRMKLKKRVLQARMNNTNINTDDIRRTITISDNFNSLDNSNAQCAAKKRKNPFVTKSQSCKKPKDIALAGLEISNDNTLFELLNINVQQGKQVAKTSIDNNSTLNFTNVLSRLDSPEEISNLTIPKGEKYIPIDWTLKTKMRFMSPKPFPWNGKLKTSEEASGTTGFVRCLNIGEKETTLDTSPNARFVSHRDSLITHLYHVS